MNEVLEEIIKDQEINVSDDGIQTISVLAEAQVDLEEQIEEKTNELKVLKENTVSASFGRDEDDAARELLDELKRNGMNTAQKEWVEPMTLKAFVREQVEKGVDLPYDAFNIYIGQRSKITKR